MHEITKKLTDKKFLAEQSKQTLLAVLGVFLYAVGMNLFIVPVHLYSGGLMGFCQVLRTFLVNHLHLSFGAVDIAGLIYYLLNVPLFIIAIKNIGRKFFAKTVICVTAMTLFLSAIPVPAKPIMEADTMASCLIGGIVCGVGIGLPLKMGCSAGGMDIVGLLLIKWKKNFSVGKLNLLVNIVLYSICLFLFDIPTVIYSLIYAAVNSTAVDKIHSQNINVEVSVITKQFNEEMEKEILAHLDRGITKWQAKGAYTEEDTQVLYILLSKYELPQLKYIIYKNDPHAFVVVNEGVHINGHFLKKL